MSKYIPILDEVETAFHEFASDLESRNPGTYPEAPEFADWKEAMWGFQRWLEKHNSDLRSEWEAEHKWEYLCNGRGKRSGTHLVREADVEWHLKSVCGEVQRRRVSQWERFELVNESEKP